MRYHFGDNYTITNKESGNNKIEGCSKEHPSFPIKIPVLIKINLSLACDIVVEKHQIFL